MKKSIDYITSKYTNYNFYILTFDYFEKTIKKIIKNKNIEIISDYKLKQKKMGESSYAIAASGSVTLELCKYQTPMIVVYDTNFITQIILKLLVKVNYCTLINIFFNKEIIPELIFQKFTYKNLISHFEFLMKTEKYKKMQKKYMIEFSKKMINNGNPSKLLVDNILK